MHLRVPIIALLLTASPLAAAQYIWVDSKGVKQLSDRPPPPDIPEKRILKAPGKPVFNPYAPAEAESPTTTVAKPPPTIAERDADFKQRQSEAAEKARLAADAAQRNVDKTANCEAARKNQLALDQGLRLSTFDKNGERGYMNDAEREELRKNTQKVLVDCK